MALNYSQHDVLEVSAEGRVFKFYYRTQEDLKRIKERLMQIIKKEDKDYSEEEWEKFYTKRIHEREKEMRRVKKMRKVVNGTLVQTSSGRLQTLSYFLEERQNSHRALSYYWRKSAMKGIEEDPCLQEAFKLWCPKFSDLSFFIRTEELDFTQRTKVTISAKE